MKSKILTLFAIVLGSAAVNAQDLVEMIKRDINSERRTIIAEAMEIPKEKETDFWAIYNDLEHEFSILTDKRAVNIEKFAENYETMSDDMAHDIAMTYYEVNIDRFKLYKKYYNKMSKVISKKEASRFVQLLGQIQLIIDMQIAAEVPLIK